MNTLITFPDGREVTRPAPSDDAEFWRMAEAWLTRYPPTPISPEQQSRMDADFLVVARRLLPNAYPTPKGK